MAKKTATPQLDLFLNDVENWGPKSDRASLEHPFFSISKKKDLSIRNYTSPDGKVSVEVTPSVKGMATIYDKDILIYAISVLRAATKGEKQNPKGQADSTELQEQLEFPAETAAPLRTLDPGRMREGVAKEVIPVKSRPINIIAYNLLHAIGRDTSGRAYKDLEEALDRLENTSIKTNIPVGKGYVCTESFRIIDKFRIIREQGTDRMLYIQLILSDWLWTAAVEGESDLLLINREYFNLTSGLERRIYELCRKHCGHQPYWSIGMEKLYKKSGSNSSLREFRRMIRKIVEKNTLPSYVLAYDQEKDQLISRTMAAASLAEV